METTLAWDGLSIARTGGQHGTGEIALELAPVSGFVIGCPYIAGDTIWCREVEEAIASHGALVPEDGETVDL